MQLGVKEAETNMDVWSPYFCNSSWLFNRVPVIYSPACKKHSAVQRKAESHTYK